MVVKCKLFLAYRHYFRQFQLFSLDENLEVDIDFNAQISVVFLPLAPVAFNFIHAGTALLPLILQFFNFIETRGLLGHRWLLKLRFVALLVTRGGVVEPDAMMLFQPIALLTSGAESWQFSILEFVQDLLRVQSINLLLFLTHCSLASG